MLKIKVIFYILFGIIWGYNVFGQTSSELNIIVNHTKKGHANIVHADIALDSTQNTLILFLHSKTKSFVHLFKKEGVYKPLSNFEYHKDELNTIYPQYTLFKDDIISFPSSLDGKLYLSRLNLKTGDLNSERLKTEHKKYRGFTGRVLNNTFYLFGISKKDYAINVMKITADGHVNERLLEYPNENFIKPKWFFDSKFNRHSVLANWQENEFLENIGDIKQYNRAHSVLFSINKDSITYTIDIPLDQGEITTYKNKVNKPMRKLRQMNSYILDKHIYQVALNDKEYWVGIKDLETNKLLNDFTFNKENGIRFINSKIEQKGGKLSSFYNKKTLTNFKDMFKALYDNVLTLSVKQIEEAYYLSLGSMKFIYDEFDYLYQSPLKTTKTSSSILPKYFPYFKRSTQFMILLDENLKQKTERLELDITCFKCNYEEQIEKETAKLVYQLKDKVFYGYYDYKNHNYILKAFNKSISLK